VLEKVERYIQLANELELKLVKAVDTACRRTVAGVSYFTYASLYS
jgi:hypothetical protein